MGRLSRVALVALALLAGATPAAAKQFAYVTNADPLGGHVAQYSVDPFGGLAPLVPPSVASAYHPGAIVIAPGGRNAYVATDNGVERYAIGRDGKLTHKELTDVGAPESTALAITPDGRRLYVSSLFGRTIVALDVGPEGRLTPGTAAPTRVDGPGRIVVGPDGRSLYATVELGTAVLQFDIGADGTLTPKTPDALPTGSSPIGVAISPDGRSLYAVAVGDKNGSISQFDIGANGLLQQKTPASVPAGFAAIDIALTPDGRSAYVTNQGDDTLSQYDVDPAGRLTPKSPATVAAADLPYGLAVAPDGRRLYVTNFSGDSVFQYEIGPDGKLTHRPAGDRPAKQPIGIAIAVKRPTRHEAVKACRFERVAHGRAAFRARYGRHPWRSCIRAVLSSP